MNVEEKKSKELVKNLGLISRLMVGVLGLLLLLVSFMTYALLDPDLSMMADFFPADEEEQVLSMIDVEGVVDGIHVETGFIDAPGMAVTIQNCTSCHSSKLVLANRMNEQRWKETIEWMQETQNLWDLGENEKTIIDYLVTNYPPKKIGRRAKLENIEWYELQQ